MSTAASTPRQKSKAAKEIGVTDSLSPAKKPEGIPHVENVDLVPESHAHGGAAGFDGRHFLGLSLVLLFLIVIAYLVLR
jgi:hypothetical protein